MVGVVYKELHSSKMSRYNKSDVNTKSIINKNHIKYIATRTGTAFGSNCHGLFGYINSMKDIDKENIKDIVNHISDNTKKGVNIHKSIISLSEEEAIKNGFVNRDKWQEMMSVEIRNIAKEYNIKNSNLEWVASFHTEKGHPHSHLIFYDKSEIENKHKHRYTNYTKIRDSLNRAIFQGEYTKNMEAKNQARRELKKNSNDFLNSIVSVDKKYLNDNKKELLKVKKILDLETEKVRIENKVSYIFDKNSLEYVEIKKYANIRTYTAMQLSKILGVTNKEIGNLASKNNLKNDIYCRKELDAYGKDIYKYNENIIPKLAEILNKKDINLKKDESIIKYIFHNKSGVKVIKSKMDILKKLMKFDKIEATDTIEAINLQADIKIGNKYSLNDINILTPNLLPNACFENKFDEQKINKLIILLNDFKAEGINYKYESIENKNKLNEISSLILSCSKECREEHKKYIDYSYNKKETTEKELLKNMGNNVLYYLQNINRKEENILNNINYNIEKIKRETVVNLITNIFYSIQNENKRNRAILNSKNIKFSSLSKQAQKEKILKLKDKSNLDWERE